MALRVTGPPDPPVWAIPISADVVALWCELSPGLTDVAIALDGMQRDLLFKRRLISRGRRLHVFAYRAADYASSPSCTVTYRAGRDGTISRYHATASLAEWPRASVMAVAHAIVDAFLDAGGALPADMRLLLRFLSLASSWAPPLRFQGRDGGLCAAVFGFTASAPGPTTVLAVMSGALVVQRVTTVPADADNTALLWRGDVFDRAYVEHQGELLELKASSQAAGEQSVAAWFAELAPHHQDPVLDGVLQLGPAPGTGLETLGPHVPFSRDFRLGHFGIEVAAAFAFNTKICVALKNPSDLDVDVTVQMEIDTIVPTRAIASVSAGDGLALFSTNSDVCRNSAPGRPIRVTVSAAGLVSSHWILLLEVGSHLARRRILNLVDWERADEAFVRDFADAVAHVGLQASAPPPPVMALTTLEPPERAALFVCRYGGDFAALRSTLVALGLTTTDLTVRLVTSQRLSPREALDLRELCQRLDLPATLVTLEAAAPFSDATKGLARHAHRFVLFADSGLVPIDRDWWARIASIVERDPTLLCYCFADGQPEKTSALTFLKGSAPLLVAGWQIAEDILDGPIELQTYEGLVHQALSAAERVGRAERLGWLKLLATGGASSGASIGAVRFDEAVVTASMARRRAKAPARRNNLVQIAPLAG